MVNTAGTGDMKKYNEDFLVENGVLYVRLTGEFPNELFHKGDKLFRNKENLFQPLINACSAYNCKRALIDARDLQVDFGTVELFQAGRDAALLTRDDLRVAILAREDMRDGFFEYVVREYGGSLSVFTNMDIALDWLKG
jgi:hypothetical protein